MNDNYSVTNFQIRSFPSGPRSPALSIAGCVDVCVMNNTEYAPDELARRIYEDKADNLFVLDVRNEDDYGEWRIDGSYNIPIYDELLASDFSMLEANLDRIPKDKEIVVVCVGGITSARAADFLRNRGYDAQSMTDGMNGWGRVHRTYDVDGVENVVQIVRPGTGCTSYLVYDESEAIVVDPSLYVEKYLSFAEEHDVEIVGAIDTHAHADHVSGARRLAGELDVPYYLHGDDSGELNRVTLLEDDDTIEVGDRELKVVHTPGHTPGSVSFEVDDALLSGDTLFIRSVGRPDLEGNADAEIREAASQLFESLATLTDLEEDRVVLPGHFSDESVRPLATELGTLRENNELLGYAVDGDEQSFVETIVEALSDEPANYNRIKSINWGEEQPDADVASLELGPNNCAAN